MEEDIQQRASKSKICTTLKKPRGKRHNPIKKKISRFECVIRKEQSQMAISNRESIN